MRHRQTSQFQIRRRRRRAASDQDLDCLLTEQYIKSWIKMQTMIAKIEHDKGVQDHLHKMD